VTVRYADTSALVRCWLPGEDPEDGEQLRVLLLDGPDPVVTSELTRVELASAAEAAVRAGRIRRSAGLLARADRAWSEDGPVALLALEPRVVLPLARRIVLDHAVPALDALHLAVAGSTTVKLAAGDPIEFVTRDPRQAEAASALGMLVR
jgi:predicted nucleic acid-binding protein